MPIVLVALLLASGFALPQAAASIRLLESAIDRPVAVRGGVLMVPLRVRKAGDEWPRFVDLEFEDGRSLRGDVAWLSSVRNSGPRRWTEEARALEVRWIRPTDGPTAGSPSAPYLLVNMPPDARGAIRLGKQTIEPVWFDRLPPLSALGREPLLRDQHDPRPDRPDPRSPFEFWRWVLLARHLDAAPPSPTGYGDAGDMVARHYAELWQVAFDRLARADESLAYVCLGLLTRTCRDRGVSFAAWVTDPNDHGLLLRQLLEVNRSDEDLARAARGWIEDREPILMWLEADDGQSVRLAAVNRSHDPLIARFTWQGVEDIPIAVELPPDLLTPVVIDRPERVEEATRIGRRTPAPDLEVLEIQLPDRVYRLPVEPRAIVARPPGTFFHTLNAPLTLAEVETGQLLPVAEAWATFVHLRRLSRRWEIFFECHRPAREAPGGNGREARYGFLPAGEEAVTVLIGPERFEGSPNVHLVVPETGWFQLRRGDNDGSLQIYRRSLADRWYCRIVLPDDWSEGGELLTLGCARTFGGRAGYQVAPASTPPWREVVGRQTIDLSEWDDPPREIVDDR